MKKTVTMKPVSNQKSEYLFQTIVEVFKKLKLTDTELQAIVFDGHRVNEKLYSLLLENFKDPSADKDEIGNFIIVNEKRVYLLFCMVHLIKNTWFNLSKNVFHFPSYTNSKGKTIEGGTADFKYISQLYSIQKDLERANKIPDVNMLFSMVKPTKYDKQNYYLARHLYQPKIRYALMKAIKEGKIDEKATGLYRYLHIIDTYVLMPFIGNKIHSHNPLDKRFENSTDERLTDAELIVDWLQIWENNCDNSIYEQKQQQKQQKQHQKQQKQQKQQFLQKLQKQQKHQQIQQQKQQQKQQKQQQKQQKQQQKQQKQQQKQQKQQQKQKQLKKQRP